MTVTPQGLAVADRRQRALDHERFKCHAFDSWRQISACRRRRHDMGGPASKRLGKETRGRLGANAALDIGG